MRLCIKGAGCKKAKIRLIFLLSCQDVGKNGITEQKIESSGLRRPNDCTCSGVCCLDAFAGEVFHHYDTLLVEDLYLFARVSKGGIIYVA